MRQVSWMTMLGLAGLATLTPAVHAQTRPYIGFVYPAGGQQGMTVQIRLGGQGIDDANVVLVTGPGVSARVVECYRRLGNQEQSLISEQLRELKQPKKGADAPAPPMMAAEMTMMSAGVTGESSVVSVKQELIAKIEKRLGEYVSTPACASIANLVFVEVTIATDAPPGEREIRLVGLRGVSNPLAFHVGQVPEYSRKPMRTATVQTLGKEAQSLRKRPPEQVEDRVEIPCTVNGQIASGEVNRYRFTARKGQRLVFTTLARQLIPYIADAVPGWFQPVLTLADADGKQVAYDDDYRFQPDPVISYEVPKDGEYVLTIADALYRGREDFVYRVTIGELPFVTGIYPLGERVGETIGIKMNGWNLQDAVLSRPAKDAKPGVYQLVADRKGVVSNPVPFELGTLPECVEKEPNNDPAHAQQVTLPVIINGRIDKPGDGDVYRFQGKAGETVVAEVTARRLDSPLDSVLKLTDATGKLLALNDDCQDPGDGLHTHHADSYLLTKLPADGTYYVQLGDTAGKGGEEYAYRLRLGPPQPDFALRVAPSSTSLRGKNSATLNVYAFRKDGFAGPIKLALKDPPPGFSASPTWLTGTQVMARLSFKTDLAVTKEPVNLIVEGRAKIGEEERVHEAVPAEDRMQAFLWRQLVPAQEFQALVFDPAYEPPPKRVAPVRPPPPAATNATVAAVSTNTPPRTPGKFTKQQVASRLRELKRLYEEGYLTDDFYNAKVAECEATL